MAYFAQVNLPPRAIDLRLLSFSSVLNLTFLSRNGRTQVAKITISEYNHNTSRRPFDILTARAVSSPFLPRSTLIQYCELRESSPGPLFCHADQSPILTHQFKVELQRCLAYCGLDTSRYKSHSFRIGGPCHAADRGYSDEQIRALGRWKSAAFKVYLRSEVLQAN